MPSDILKKLGLCLFILMPADVFAADTPFDAASTVWLMVSAILVLMMFIPGLALFYGGMLRAKNVLSIFSQFLAVAGVVGILWIAIVYSIVADTTHMSEGSLNLNSFVGGLGKAFMAGITDQTGCRCA